MTDSQKMVLECLSDEPDEFHSTQSIRRKCGREMISAIRALERAGAVEAKWSRNKWRLTEDGKKSAYIFGVLKILGAQ